jgi:spoIIIJ-associated protein
MDSMEFDGKDLDDALAAAAKVLGHPVSDLDYVILEGGRKGVFGLGARPVRVRVSGATPARMPADPVSIEPNPAPNPRSTPAEALVRIIEYMGFDLSVEETRRDATVELVLDGPDRKRLAAKDGELISALEFVLARMGRRAWPDEPQVRLVCRGFRSGKDDEIIDIARSAATEVARSGRPKRLHAMNPYERRVVHVTVREFEGLTTVSEGDGFLKRIRVEKIAP